MNAQADSNGEAPLSSEPLSESSALEKVAALFSPPEKDADEAPPPEETPATDPPPTEKWDVKALAEKLGTDPAKLYESLKVPLADGLEISLSALKDAYKPAKELEKAKAAWLDERATAETESQQLQRDFSNLLARLPPQALTQDLMSEVNRMGEAQHRQQAEQLLKLIPEWKDPVSKAAGWVDIAPLATEYGFSQVEIKMAQAGYADPRFIAMSRELAGLRAKVKAATPPPKPKVAVEPKGGKPQTDAQQFGRIKASVTSGRLKPAQAVEALFQGRK